MRYQGFVYARQQGTMGGYETWCKTYVDDPERVEKAKAKRIRRTATRLHDHLSGGWINNSRVLKEISE